MPLPPTGPERLLSRHADRPGLAGALLFALVAERLTQFYDHGEWVGDGRMRQLALEWLTRAKMKIESPWLRELVAASSDMAKGIAASLSREAGLQTAHEMGEALDPNHQSAVAHLMMEQCIDWVAAMQQPDEFDEDALR